MQLQEVCVDWRKAVEESTKVQDRLSKVTLHKAAVQGWMRVAKILLARGDDPNTRIVCDDCVPPEHSPCGFRCDICEEISKKALSWTALHGAVALGRKEMTQLLLSKGADTSSKLRLFVFYDEPPNQGPLVEPHTHEVTAIHTAFKDGSHREFNEKMGPSRPRMGYYPLIGKEWLSSVATTMQLKRC